ncbi:alpha/beta hydrolase fold [Actinomadura madurae]|uniref:Alpha/beta hydrolase fold n=1 Tax=Actinomadura madurae TaxID=1993 RepID=A0A1I5JKH6_9ACTN|nr:alpha/beta hydrolase [Actinomadura madurae]SFO73245.1 alpha/beta hydrolase fold [Actinomadura madurae]
MSVINALRAVGLIATAPLSLIFALPTAAASAPNDLARYSHQHLAWTRCRQGPGDQTGTKLDQAGAQCATVTVPLDYGDPGGRTIKVAMSRLKATDTAGRIGTMLLNSGGPAGTAIDMPPDWRTIMGSTGGKYDLVGMDPRFVGRSTPLDCGWPTGHWMRSPGLDRAAFDRSAAFARDLAHRCAQKAGDVLPHVTTRNTARDMDLIRQILGERKISYLGYSYGTYLGAVFSQMFPERIDRMVLDGAIDPRKFGPLLLADAAPANERALHAWAAWAAERDATYHLGSTRRAVLATIDQIIHASARQPLHIGAYQVDAHITPMVIVNALADDRSAPRTALAETVRVLHRAATRGHAEPTPELDEGLRFLLTGAESAYGSQQISIICGDVAGSRDPETYWHDIQRSRPHFPVSGPAVNNISPCAYWPEPPREQPTHIHNDTPALIVAATGDPRTIYQHGQALHRFMTRSRLLTLNDATIHAVYGNYGNTCVDGQVNRYLDTGILPAQDLSCANKAEAHNAWTTG